MGLSQPSQQVIEHISHRVEIENSCWVQTECLRCAPPDLCRSCHHIRNNKSHINPSLGSSPHVHWSSDQLSPASLPGNLYHLPGNPPLPRFPVRPLPPPRRTCDTTFWDLWMDTFIKVRRNVGVWNDLVPSSSTTLGPQSTGKAQEKPRKMEK